ncbi:MAG: DoxX family protein, partial [Bacteroidota bacterium]
MYFTDRIQSFGKWLFASPMAVFGFLHFGPLEFSLPYVPFWLPFPAFWVYFAGVGLLLFAVSAVLGRKDRLAALLLALELILFILLIHVPKAMEGDFL